MKITQNKSITFLETFSLNIFTHGFVFLSPLFGDTNLCFAFSCSAIGNKGHDVKKQQQQKKAVRITFFP